MDCLDDGVLPTLAARTVPNFRPDFPRDYKKVNMPKSVRYSDRLEKSVHTYIINLCYNLISVELTVALDPKRACSSPTVAILNDVAKEKEKK